MKKRIAFFLAVLLTAVMVVVPAGAQVAVEEGYDYTRFADDDITLNVYNWGLYISDGTDDSLDVVKEFEELTGIRVNYTTYDTNESLYSKLKSGGGQYDVIVPSDYMIGKMIKEDMLEKLDFSNIPNYAMIGEEYKNQSFDPDNEYAVPYTWGVVGIVYNTTMVDDPVTSWNSLWDPRYSGQILMFNNSRDAYAIASKKLGLSLNPSTEEDVSLATEELKAQKSIVQAYVMDEIFDKMEGGEAALAPYYAGDALTMIGDNPDLAFSIPAEGTNFFVDAMCIPKGSKHKEAAEMFINFMCETEIALANTEFIGYSTPQKEAMELLPEELKNSPIMYPDAQTMAATEAFDVLPEEIALLMDKQWSDVRSYDESGSSRYMIPIMLVLAVAVVVLILRHRAIKKFRDDY